MNSESLSSSSADSPSDRLAMPDAGSENRQRRGSKSQSGNGYVSDADDLINRTPLWLVLEHYGFAQPQNSTSE